MFETCYVRAEDEIAGSGSNDDQLKDLKRVEKRVLNASQKALIQSRVLTGRIGDISELVCQDGHVKPYGLSICHALKGTCETYSECFRATEVG